jgi:pimeloyl-[acyl-carrier protein] methyl ester esterase
MFFSVNDWPRNPRKNTETIIPAENHSVSFRGFRGCLSNLRISTLIEMSELFTQSSGDGPDLVLIHGWGLHAGVWDGFVPLLEPHFRVLRVDLPGHGSSSWSGEVSLDEMAAAVLAVAPANAAWLGWSLGGLVAMRAALQAPARVGALLLLASTPCFVRRPDWQCALLPALLDSFAAELQQDYLRTLNRFLALQVRGSEHSGAVLRVLRTRLLEKGEPAPAALQAGLDILRNTDLRSEVGALACPVLVVAGDRDTLVPAAAAGATADLIPNAGSAVVAGAGHAPFIARPEVVAGMVHDFLQMQGTAGNAHA